MNTPSQTSKLSVIVPVCERSDQAAALFPAYREACENLATEVEYIYVTSMHTPDIVEELQELKANEPNLRLIVLNRSYGEGTALQAGFDHASGDLVLTLPPYLQVELSELPKLFTEIEKFDVVLGRRSPRLDTGLNKLQSHAFNWLLKRLTDQSYSDIGCGVRLIRKDVAKELHLYGEQHRFLPLLAYQIGFHATEVDMQQAESDAHRRVYAPGIYLRRVLDLITIVFLTKFNKKPLRFFGLLGSTSIAIGILGLLYIAFQRLFMDIAMADRPVLVMFSLFLVLGVQLMAIGLVGETVIFTHAKANEEYRIKKINGKQ